MDITRTHTFDHPLEVCWSMFHDPASHVAKFEAMGHREIELISSEVTDDSIELVIERLVDVDVPGFAKRVIQPTNLLRSVDEWHAADDGSYRGTFDVETKGVPIQISGTTRLEAADEGTEYEIMIRLSVKVPLIGGRIAQYSKGIVERQVTDEFRLGDEWLDTHAPS